MQTHTKQQIEIDVQDFSKVLGAIGLCTQYFANTKENNMSEIKKDGWIPIEESAPETEKYIMVSFENFTLPDIARYETDEQGNGAFYPGDEDKPYIGYGLVVNAWMPLPKPYREEEEAAVDETTQKTDTGAERTDNIK